MAGFKTANLNKNPVFFLTFDGDSTDPLSGAFLSSPIIDESGNNNHATLMSDGTGLLGYKAGMASLVPLEQDQQAACSFGFYSWYGTTLPQNFLSISKSSSMFFDSHNGSYTVSFLLRKNNLSEFWTNNPSHPSNRAHSAPLIRCFDYQGRPNDTDFAYCSISFDTGSQYGQNYFNVLTPSGHLQVDSATTNRMMDQNWHHVVVVFDCSGTGGTYSSTTKIYLDGRIVLTKTLSLNSRPTPNASPWEIGGYSGFTADGTYRDRCGERTDIDQLAAFDYALSEDDVLYLYKKTASYFEISTKNPNLTYMTQMYDPENINDWHWKWDVGSGTLNTYSFYKGNVSTILRDQPGPPQIAGSRSVLFQNGGWAMGSGNSNTFNWSPTDYTILFWYKSGERNAGVLYSIENSADGFLSSLLWVNKKDNTPYIGALQFNATPDSYLSSNPGIVSVVDGQWHAIAIRRISGLVSLWIDGIQHGASTLANVNPGGGVNGGSLMLFREKPGESFTQGSISNLAFFSEALSDSMIRMYSNWSKIYRIKGTVKLRGAPYAAKIRAHRHVDGSLSKELLSKTDGSYLIELNDNADVDMLVMGNDDDTVRYRAYGPIKPADFEDYSA